MMETSRILLLSGSAEARQIAAALVAQGLQVRALKSEAPRGANLMPVPFEVLETVNIDVLRAAVRTADAVIDASHGFDVAMTEAGHAAALAEGVPFVSFQRPPWDVAEHAKWRSVPDVAAAMALIGPEARIFSATGWASLPEYAAFRGETVMLRQTTRHDRPPPFDFLELVFGDPPFTAAQEKILFRELRVDTLICRNLGGMPSRPKLDAAKALDLDVILVDRPTMPPTADVLRDVPAVLDWVAAL